MDDCQPQFRHGLWGVYKDSQGFYLYVNDGMRIKDR